jgi:hypothetical protein
MHHQVLQWIDPRFSVEQVFENWPAISESLAEAPRKRIPQVLRFF